MSRANGGTQPRRPTSPVAGRSINRIPRAFSITSSLLLQGLLHVNVLFDVVLLGPGLLITWIIRAATGDAHERAYQILLPMFAIVLAAEGPRLALGYSGNLGERVPHLFLWLVLSFFPVLAMLIAILVIRANIQELTDAMCPSCLTPFEVVLICLEIVIVITSGTVGIFAMRRLIAVKTFRFYEQYFVTSMTELQPRRFYMLLICV
ncbi:hypothetical protein FOL47_004896 [Perkinsus chesapeaki]|uniref:Uncharacterized protein n=1 Tax=Perkinsus chesapeaki TaxID=330153 RepID=A0A7J6M005_PERCH|nr:hypothetical protein FOL47_004896 [Perkinsus chesapeaki]